jgi:methylmalonyl-CoA/ethylmalonyl-CoA epimerase
MIARIDHVGIAVRDYETAKAFLEKALGAVSVASMEDSNLNYLWHIFTLGDMSRMELITPSGEPSFLANFLKTREGGIHHITLETPDINEAKRRLEENNVPYFGFNEIPEFWSELFIHPKDTFGVLIQICQFGPKYHLIEPVKRPQGKRWRIQSNETGYELSVHHPGGVELKLSLSKEEIKDMVKDLMKALEE